MNTSPIQSAPAHGVPHDLSFENGWDAAALRELIEARRVEGRPPSWLFLGRRESSLLRQHLISAFGDEAVSSLHRVYYMGLEVIELEAPNFCRLAGRKFMGKLAREKADLRSWKGEDFSRWRFQFS